MSKKTAEIIVRHLLGIVAALQKEFDLPSNVTVIEVSAPDSLTSPPNYDIIPKTE